MSTSEKAQMKAASQNHPRLLHIPLPLELEALMKETGLATSANHSLNFYFLGQESSTLHGETVTHSILHKPAF